MRRTNRVTVVFGIIITFLLIALLAVAMHTQNQYRTYQSHRVYLRNPNADIQPWMTVPTVVRHFNVSESIVYKELQMNRTFYDSRSTLDTICRKSRLNCTDVIRKLNALRP
jgi:hypothetical protein